MNKYVLKISPLQPEFRRGMLHAVNPVGVAASGLSIAMYFHVLGDTLQPYSPVAAVIAFVLTPPVEPPTALDLICALEEGVCQVRRAVGVVDGGVDMPQSA